MKILMLTSYLPYPPHAGGRLRVAGLLRFLQPRHEVTLVTFMKSEKDLPFVRELAKMCTRVVPVLRTEQPFRENHSFPRRIAECWTPEMRQAVRILNTKYQFDLVDIEQIFMAEYASLISAPAVLHEHNIESLIMKRYAGLSHYYEDIRPSTHIPSPHFRDMQTEWIKMTIYETATWPKFPVRITVSDLDREEMLKRCPHGRVVVIPNGVSTQELQPVGDMNAPHVFFTGAMDYQPNLDAAFELCKVIWPLVQQQIPQACLYIVGRKVPPELFAKSRPGQIEIISDAPDLAYYAARCSVSAVPLRVGGGTRIKILTAMALGLPVVSTSLGCEGLPFCAGGDLLIADDPEQFAQQIVYLIHNKEKRLTLARNGRNLVEQQYDWQKSIFPLFERLYEEVRGK